MVKLLGIVGSPRRGGNTEIMMKEVLKSGEGEGAETELIHLVDFNLEPCDGCRICFGEDKTCHIKDDLDKIFEKMLEADGIILGSPVYFMNVTAQMKALIDRVGFSHLARGRNPFRNKIGGVLAVTGKYGLSSAISKMLFFLISTRMIIVPPFVSALGWNIGDVTQETLNNKLGFNDARELGKTMVRTIKATASLRGVHVQEQLKLLRLSKTKSYKQEI